MAEQRKLSCIAAIKEYFEKDGGRKVENAEMLALKGGALREVGQMCADSLGAVLSQ